MALGDEPKAGLPARARASLCVSPCACAHVSVSTGVCERQRQEEVKKNENIFFFEGKSQKLHLFKNILPLTDKYSKGVDVSPNDTFQTNPGRVT